LSEFLVVKAKPETMNAYGDSDDEGDYGDDYGDDSFGEDDAFKQAIKASVNEMGAGAFNDSFEETESNANQEE
jgi:hypothetical protein